MTLDELRAVNRYAESTKSLSYLPQVRSRALSYRGGERRENGFDFDYVVKSRKRDRKSAGSREASRAYANPVRVVSHAGRRKTDGDGQRSHGDTHSARLQSILLRQYR